MKLSIWRAFARSSPVPPWDNPEPIREELFGAERLEQHARSLAEAQPVSARPISGQPLADRLADNGAKLLEAYHSIASVIAEGKPITPAAEWLIDNYYVVERQIREIRADLPPRYYRQLPKLADGPFTGYPRVLGLAWAFVAHTDSRFDPELLCRFVRAYQEVQPLTIGELWAVAITLRIVLVENLRRIAMRVTASRAARKEADAVADRLLGAKGREIDLTLLSTYDEVPPASSFVMQLVHRLRDQDARIRPALAWIDQKLAAAGTTADEVVRLEHQRQAAATVTVRNIITSMRLISDVDWAELFEKVSFVDDVLTAGSGFAAMDFQTRNLYRRAIEELARGSNKTELDIARGAVEASQKAAKEGAESRQQDPGYYLLAGGRRAFEAALGFSPPLYLRLARISQKAGIRGYAGAGAVAATLLLSIPLFLLAQMQIAPPSLVLIGIVGLVPALDLAVALVNRAVTSGFGAKLLPALALRESIPEVWRTLVAVPSILTSRETVEELIERLEVHFLASPPGALHFALLTDWPTPTLQVYRATRRFSTPPHKESTR